MSGGPGQPGDCFGVQPFVAVAIQVRHTLVDVDAYPFGRARVVDDRDPDSRDPAVLDTAPVRVRSRSPDRRVQVGQVSTSVPPAMTWSTTTSVRFCDPARRLAMHPSDFWAVRAGSEGGVCDQDRAQRVDVTVLPLTKVGRRCRLNVVCHLNPCPRTVVPCLATRFRTGCQRRMRRTTSLHIESRSGQPVRSHPRGPLADARKVSLAVVPWPHLLGARKRRLCSSAFGAE